MKVVVRQPRRREIELAGSRRVNELLRELRLNPESHIVLQGRRLLTRDALIQEDETVEVLSAISGGL